MNNSDPCFTNLAKQARHRLQSAAEAQRQRELAAVHEEGIEIGREFGWVAGAKAGALCGLLVGLFAGVAGGMFWISLGRAAG